ncbi:MAG: ABC-F family ATP-binding cassette domain-containing protein [Candidatus Gracilibacteria bacterium]|nr:ABC-F family ATP-binding cassette domain-containing protein [Candidatus Gracilibacteria bacterium]
MNHLNINIIAYGKKGEIILGPISTVINADERIAIVGKNGVGKSTFMKILTGNITEYQGNIENIGGITLGYLEQIHFMDESRNVREDLKDAFAEIRSLENEIRKEEEKMNETGEYERYTELIEQFKLLGGYTYENEIERVARGIGIFHLLERTLQDVSGGERTKIALAKTLLSKPEFLLLDEPTNFIDLESVEWLEKYLENSWKGGYMIVSHDREFLDRTCTKVIEILGPQGISIYHGDYSYSVDQKKLAMVREEKAYEEQQTMLESEKALINRFRAGSRAGFAKSREKQLERIELIDQPIRTREIGFRFETPKERAPENILKVEDAFIGRKEPLFYVRDAQLSVGERVGIVGENGVGKSTFLKTILRSAHYEEVEGENEDILNHLIENYPHVLEGYLNLAKGIRIGYYSQLHESLRSDMTIIENFTLHGLPYSLERVGGIIGQYGFAYHDGSKKVSSLSGGERSRLLFAILCQNPYHLLILDEPTNHLDYETRESLEQAMQKYEGTVLFISHDRYFVNKLANKLWIIQDGELIISYGNYDDYQYKKEHGISLDMSLFNADGELDLVLEEKLGSKEAKRIREKFARRRK